MSTDPEVKPSNVALVAHQLGRELKATPVVAVRCSLHLPVVVEVSPTLRDGSPFPTRFWLTCPLARRRVARLEERGGVREVDERRRTDTEFNKAMIAAHESYTQSRDRLVQPHAKHQPHPGVGGSTATKCLHAHFAHFAAGGPNPTGQLVSERIGPLECTVPCVTHQGRNSAWREVDADVEIPSS